MNFICSQCGNSYEREHATSTRGVRRKTLRLYCSQQCVGVSRRNPYKWIVDLLRTQKRVRARRGGESGSLTHQQAASVFEDQGGLCKITNFPLNPAHPNPLLRPSIDRIDSSRGYEIDNIQFVIRAYNLMKNQYTDAQAKEVLTILGLAS